MRSSWSFHFLSSWFTYLQIVLSLHQSVGSFQQSTSRTKTRPRGQEPAGQPGAPGAHSWGWPRKEGQVAGCGQPNQHTARPNVLPQRASVGGAVPEPPHSACAENRSSDNIRCSWRGTAAFHLPTGSQEVLGNSSALPVPIAFGFVPWIILPFLSKPKWKSLYERWVATSYSTVHAAFPKLRCQFPWCRGSGSAASPTVSRDLHGNVCRAGHTLLHHHPGLNCSAVLNSHAWSGCLNRVSPPSL